MSGKNSSTTSVSENVGNNNCCPSCGAAIQPYFQFCPACDADLVVTDPGDFAQIPGKEIALQEAGCSCPQCGQGVDRDQEYCPYCDFEISGVKVAPVVDDPVKVNVSSEPEAEAEPVASPIDNSRVATSPSVGVEGEGADAVVAADNAAASVAQQSQMPGTQDVSGINSFYCSGCGTQVQADYVACPNCGIKLELTAYVASQVHPAAGAVRPVSIPQVYSGGRMQPQNVAMANVPPSSLVSQSSIWDVAGSTFPVVMAFNAGKIFYVGETNFLELAISSNLHQPIEDLQIEVDSNLLRKSLKESNLQTLQVGAQLQLQLAGFLSEKHGHDIVNLKVSGRVQGPGKFYLQGRFPVTVQARETSQPQNINVNISAQGSLNMVGDMDVGLKDLNPIDLYSQKPVDRWIPVSLNWDIRKQEKESRFFPCACIDRTLFCLESGSLERVRSCPVEKAETATLEIDNGSRYNLVSGTKLLLGRKREINHVHAVSLPVESYRDVNRMVSRNHCRILVHDNQVFIEDSSSNGTFVNGERLSRKHETRLSHGERIKVADAIEFEVGIFTDGGEIIAVLLSRINNNESEKYLLVTHHVPLGGRSDLPLILHGEPDLCGTLYFYPQTKNWRFRPFIQLPSLAADMPIELNKQISIGNYRLVLRPLEKIS